MAFNAIAASVTTMPTISWRLLNDDDKNNYKKKKKTKTKKGWTSLTIKDEEENDIEQIALVLLVLETGIYI